ncbi:hypothetical protein H6G20_09720 [Desertifilum sp. FACHB-1129]|uniref:Uncharacterized protein n=1 Tax=Desertifilum tharense IPPAS B-1220 TaxID=1781255 RepID=A0A1E5QF77_9CYAN|nr:MULTISPECIES: hypothetical protein [unclassified Desertifilum]MCD8489903.1 hypothetical protein [Desertifilum sp.]MDA0211705.1 hypothetical protein [Cyanobacteria bacterium FC1]NES97542.1 hypothetical protein [Desertifilum sp. SIO1I2]OEJ73261.1 hypothetical protein BH720_20685 [Desertifilum tharense IPPAS B-1220]MBD2311935.1 hypothetical protein [Desertifilum sp. FACHB-1129]
MNAAWYRAIKSAYRKEPIYSILFTIGAVDAAIGGTGERWGLLSFGVSLVVLTLMVRWWQAQNRQLEQPPLAPQRYLPPQSQPQIPPLSLRNK